MKKPIDNEYLGRQLLNFDEDVLKPRFAKKIELSLEDTDKGNFVRVNFDKNLEAVNEINLDKNFLTLKKNDAMRLVFDNKVDGASHYHIDICGTDDTPVIEFRDDGTATFAKKGLKIYSNGSVTVGKNKSIKLSASSGSINAVSYTFGETGDDSFIKEDDIQMPKAKMFHVSAYNLSYGVDNNDRPIGNCDSDHWFKVGIFDTSFYNKNVVITRYALETSRIEPRSSYGGMVRVKNGCFIYGSTNEEGEKPEFQHSGNFLTFSQAFNGIIYVNFGTVADASQTKTTLEIACSNYTSNCTVRVLGLAIGFKVYAWHDSSQLYVYCPEATGVKWHQTISFTNEMAQLDTIKITTNSEAAPEENFVGVVPEVVRKKGIAYAKTIPAINFETEV